MRYVFPSLVALMALGACGGDQSQGVSEPADAVAPAAPAAPAEPVGPPLPSWRVALTDKPTIVKSYSTSLGPLPGNTVESTETDTRITTVDGNGAWSGMLILGPEATVQGAVLRVELQVESGAVHVLSTIDGAPADYVPKQETVAAGAVGEVWLPIDTAGAPLLIVANGNTDGKSVAVIRKIEVLAPPVAVAPVAPVSAPSTPDSPTVIAPPAQ